MPRLIHLTTMTLIRAYVSKSMVAHVDVASERRVQVVGNVLRYVPCTLLTALVMRAPGLATFLSRLLRVQEFDHSKVG